MPHWQNWSGKLQAEPGNLVFLRSEADAQALAQAATQRGETLRVAGATHSHAPLLPIDDSIIDVGAFTGVISVDPELRTATVGGGAPIYSLGPALHHHNLALANQGDIDRQHIAGATATGTHGTGETLKNLSAQVVGIRLITAAGDIVDADPSDNASVWNAARLHLGAFGIVSAVTLQLREAYKLKEASWQEPLDAILDRSEQLAQENRHFEFFWYPRGDRAQAKIINETSDAPQYPVADEGERCNWNYEVLPNHRPHKHTEMEYSVPREHGIECMQEIRRLLQTQFKDVAWPVEYRTLASDDVWLSTANSRETVTISVHEDVRLDEAPYYRACEEIFLHYKGRPHWGKVNYLSGQQLADCHSDWDAWWQERDAIDPTGTFLNDYLKAIRP